MRGSGSLLTLAAALGCVPAAGCIELGLEVPPPERRPGGGAVAPGDCVEEEAAPGDADEEIVFDTLSVDRPLVLVAPGAVVSWVNASSQTHTATAGSPGDELPEERGGFDSGNLPGGGTAFAWRFCQPRSIEWFCRTHAATMYGYQLVIGSEGDAP